MTSLLDHAELVARCAAGDLAAICKVQGHDWAKEPRWLPNNKQDRGGNAIPTGTEYAIVDCERCGGTKHAGLGLRRTDGRPMPRLMNV